MRLGLPPWGSGMNQNPWAQLASYGRELPEHFNLSCQPNSLGTVQLWTLSFSHSGRFLIGQGQTILEAIDAARTLAKGGECPFSHDGLHHIDTSMETGPHHCFHCGTDMRARA